MDTAKWMNEIAETQNEFRGFTEGAKRMWSNKTAAIGIVQFG